MKTEELDLVYEEIVERKAQSEPDWLNKPELARETNRYAGGKGDTRVHVFTYV